MPWWRLSARGVARYGGAAVARGSVPPVPRRIGAMATAFSTSAVKPSLTSKHDTAVGGVVRTNVGVLGAMNAGKSTLMNVLTQQTTSIVDSTAGTTTDPRIATMEIHDIGAVKLYDTPGINESGELGAKKREKAFDVLRKCDTAVVVASLGDPSSVEAVRDVWAHAQQMARDASTGGAGNAPNVLVVLNLHSDDYSSDGINTIIDRFEADAGLTRGPDDGGATAAAFAAEGKVSRVLPKPPLLAVDLRSPEAEKRLVSFISENTVPHTSKAEMLPPLDFTEDSVVLLNVPMDGETPAGRLLRPQAWAQEALLRKFVSSYAYRMDLSAARSKDAVDVAREERRFRRAVEGLKHSGDPTLLITDSQAMDVVHPWTLHVDTGEPTIPITTFSIMMAHFTSGGRLPSYIRGLKAFERLGGPSSDSGPNPRIAADGSRRAAARDGAAQRIGGRVLICEACNHDRIQDDIGVVQIPRHIRRLFGDSVAIEHSFGREYTTKNLTDYDLVIHCGGCMLDQQAMQARLADIEATGVPITNYGLLLSWVQSPSALARVLEPWGWTADA